MKFSPLAALALSLALLGPAAPTAWSQSDPTIEQIYQAARDGQLQQADAMIDQVLRNHPNSAKAHYVKAELAARESNAAVARAELAQAERLAPGLPFARPEAVQALREEVNGRARPGSASRDLRRAGTPAPAVERAEPGFSWGLAALVVVLAIGLVVLLRRRSSGTQQPGAWTAASGAPQGPVPMGPGGVAPGGYGPYGPAGPYGAPTGGLGSTLGRGLATGLAVGAGAVAAQEIGRRMFGPDGSPLVPSGAPADVEPGLLDPSVNADMGGQDFGIQDGGAWDDGGGFDVGGGSDWDT